jgi:DNA-binding NarL/FixJ family response regulator
VSQIRVVILSSRSIFAEGVASRLRLHLETQDIDVIDVREQAALEQVVANHPSTVILDASDPEVANGDWLDTLLTAMPKLQVVCLDPLQDQMQVVTSRQRPVGQVDELIDLIKKNV